MTPLLTVIIKTYTVNRHQDSNFQKMNQESLGSPVILTIWMIRIHQLFVNQKSVFESSQIFQSLLEFFKVFWRLFESFGVFWSRLEFWESFGLFWNLLKSFESFRILQNLLESFGIFWNILECFRIFWELFLKSFGGSFSVCLASQVLRVS